MPTSDSILSRLCCPVCVSGPEGVATGLTIAALCYTWVRTCTATASAVAKHMRTRMFRQGCHHQARGTTHRTTYDSIKEHSCGPPPGLGLAANFGGRSPDPHPPTPAPKQKKKTRSLQLFQAYSSHAHLYILQYKGGLGHCVAKQSLGVI